MLVKRLVTVKQGVGKDGEIEKVRLSEIKFHHVGWVSVNSYKPVKYETPAYVRGYFPENGRLMTTVQGCAKL